MTTLYLCIKLTRSGDTLYNSSNSTTSILVFTTNGVKLEEVMILKGQMYVR